MKRYLFLMCILSFPFWAFGNDAGNAGYTLWQMDIGAKSAALGGAFVASAHDLNGIHYNPANIAGIKDRQLLFTAVDDFLDLKTGYLAYSQQWIGQMQWGVIAQYKNYGQMRETDISGTQMGTFSANDISIAASVADQWSERIGYGVTVKFTQSNIAQYKSHAVAADVGILYYIPHQELHIGFAVQNLGYSLDPFDKDKVKVPLTYRLGMSKTLAHLPLQIQFDIVRFHYDPSELAGGLFWILGGEFTLSDHAFLRLGYHSKGSDQKLGSSQERTAGVAFGAGFIVNRYQFDIASASNGVLGRVTQLTVGMTL